MKLVENNDKLDKTISEFLNSDYGKNVKKYIKKKYIFLAIS